MTTHKRRAPKAAASQDSKDPIVTTAQEIAAFLAKYDSSDKQAMQQAAIKSVAAWRKLDETLLAQAVQAIERR